MKNNVLFIILLIGSVLSFPYCSDECEKDAIRCDGETLEQCVDSEWKEMMHCKDVLGDGYACCSGIEGPWCYLIEECE